MDEADDEVGEDTPEWAKLLEGSAWDELDDEGDEGPPPKAAPDSPLDFDEVDEAIGKRPGAPLVPAESEGGASALLAAAKRELDRGRYLKLLTIISEAAVDRQAAEELLDGHGSLLAEFRRCYALDAAAEIPAPATPPVEGAGQPEPAGTGEHISQLVQLVFANMADRSGERSEMHQYAEKRAAAAAFPRRLVILRGPPGAGKTKWARGQLQKELGLDFEKMSPAEALAVQLTHVCSTDDFFGKMQGSPPELQYSFDANALEANHVMNEARVWLAMKAGLEPLYVDNCNMQLWEMTPYVLLAERMGYVISVERPQTICAKWDEVGHLMEQAIQKKRTGSVLGAAQIEAIIADFELLPDELDPRPAIREAARPPKGDGRPVPHTSEESVLVSPSAMLYKLERLLKESDSLLQYTPPDGKGWGVNGELGEEWHSFRELADGSCGYEETLAGREACWRTEEPEKAWTLAELSLLADLRKEASVLPRADLPRLSAHPGLRAKAGEQATKTGGRKGGGGAAPRAAGARQVSHAGAWQSEAVPTSRLERQKFRMQVQQQVEERKRLLPGAHPPAKRARAPASGAGAALQQPRVPDESEALPGVPTDQEEMSAAAFLGAVKTRLTEWGKVDQYHEFVLSLSGTVDTKAAVKILRGHDDLLSVFRRKFAPKSDLIAIKKEIREEEEDRQAQEAPRPPSYPPVPRVKQELVASGAAPFTPGGAGGTVKQEAGAPRPPDGPRPPAGLPGAKKEMVKSEVKKELVAPRPPKFGPGAFRGTVTVGDESDSDPEVHGEVSVALAVKKGRNECIAQLSKIIFRKERASGEAARQRLTMVRYATKVAAKPRFPRELFIMRGPPGVGKTAYAMQQLQDYAEYERDEELASRLTHVCAADDFFEEFRSSGSVYNFTPSKLESYHQKNEARVRLAMEAGIHPLFVDCTHLKLWEMRPHLLLADRLGYVVTVVEPQDVCEKWDDVDHLLTANSTADRTRAGKMGPHRALLEAMLQAFEPLPADQDPMYAVRNAARPPGPRAVDAEILPSVSVKPTQAPASKVRGSVASVASGTMKVKAEAAEVARRGQKRGIHAPIAF